MLAGEIMAQGGIARRVVVWVISVIGGMRGSLAVTTVAASELFGAMAHTAVGTVVAVGRMIYPSLREGGYSERFSVGLIASSGAIAVVIPPSIAMILYSVSAQQSAIALFTAGILPSLLIGLVDALYVMIYARVKRVPLTASARWETIWSSTKEASWSISTIVVIFGGIYGGVFTPTEAAGRRGDLFAVRDHGGASRGRLARSLAHHPERGVPDLANPDDRDGGGALFLAAHHQRHAAGHRRRRSRRCTCRPGRCCCRSTSSC